MSVVVGSGAPDSSSTIWYVDEAAGVVYSKDLGGNWVQVYPAPAPPPAPVVTDPRVIAGVTVPAAGWNVHQGNLVVTGTADLTNTYVSGDVYVCAAYGATTRPVLTGSNVLIKGSLKVNLDPGGNYKTTDLSPVVEIDGLDCTTVYANLGFNRLHLGHAFVHGAADSLMQIGNTQDASHRATDFALTDSYLLGGATVKPTSSQHLESLHLTAIKGGLIRNVVASQLPTDQHTWQQTTGAVVYEATAPDGTCDGFAIDGLEVIGGGYYGLYWYASNSTVNGLTLHTPPSAPNGTAAIAAVYPNTAYKVARPAFTATGVTLDGNPYALESA